MTIRAAAIRLLARREHSCWELRRKLQTKFTDAETAIAAVLAALCSENLLSDNRFAESYIRMRSARGYGLVRIANELRERGIAEELIDSSLAEASVDWQELAYAVREKRFGRAIPTNFSEQAVQMRFLQYRGFTHEQIKTTFLPSPIYGRRVGDEGI